MEEIIQEFFVQVVFPILGAIVLALVGWVLKKVADKLDDDSILFHQDKIEELAISAIGYAEEKALEKIKIKSDKITGQEKLDLAIIWLMSKAPKISREEARLWIEGMIPKIEGVGATGDKIIIE